MREKDDSARGKILEAAKTEFMERGFAEASMRTIAERAGFTTGMLYSRFADKSEIFRELVEEPADELSNYFMTVQNEFAGYSPEYQRREMHPYVAQKIDRMVDLIYDNFDAFKLILCKSGGTSYEYYVDKMIDVETESTFRFIDDAGERNVQRHVRGRHARLIAGGRAAIYPEIAGIFQRGLG